MATWNSTSAIVALRVLINDLATTPTYDDNTLLKMMAVSAIYIQQSISFDVAYSVNLSTTPPDISPDPSGDSVFTNFMVMKAACQADLSTFRTKALMEGLRAVCGPANLTIIGNLKGFKELLTIGPCAAFEAMRYDYVYGTGQLCTAILSPFIGNSFDPENLGISFNDNRDSYFD